MQSLLRTRPENLDDLTVQVALVRPGPIQGRPSTRTSSTGSGCARTRPSCRRSTTRCSREPLARHARRRRLPGPGARGRDGARRLHRRRGRGAAARDEPQAQPGGARGATASASSRARCANGVDDETADRVYDKLVGFSGFGFPKSHAAAFALLAYQSAWLRHHYPAEFLCALLNAQPMGFYPPASLVRDAQRRGVEVLPPDVNASDARSASLDGDGAVRVGLGVRPLASARTEAEAVVAERERGGPFAGVRDLAQRAPLDRRGARGARRRPAPATAFGEPRRAAALGARPRRRAGERARLGRRGAPARAAARADRRDAGAARADRRGSGCSPTTGTTGLSVGVAPARAAAPAPAGRTSSRAASCRRRRTARSVAVAGMASRASGPRPRTASSSCCSRTSSARST